MIRDMKLTDISSPDYCIECDLDSHCCRGCGKGVPHGPNACLRALNGLECK